MQRFTKFASAIVFVCVLVLGLAGCKNYNKKVVGTWDWHQLGGIKLVVQINPDGTGSITGPAGAKQMTWRIQKGNNFVAKFNEGSPEVGFMIDDVSETSIHGSDPASLGAKIIWLRKK